MHLSHYLKIYPWAASADQLLLFSTKKASKVLLARQTLHSIQAGRISPADEALLSGLGMLVADPEAEKRTMQGLLDDLNQTHADLNVTVVLNFDCNFACIYCYEGDMKGRLYMSEQTAEQLVAFIKRKFTAGKKNLVVDFYGGEPLLSTGLIVALSQELKNFAEGRGAAYRFSLITNGALLKPKVAEQLAALGCDHVKITLDGPPEVHDRYRPFRSGAGSFDVIINNIRETCDLLSIGIGGNFDRTTWRQFPRLLDRLEKEGLTPDKIAAVKFDPISNRPAGTGALTDYHGGCMDINEPWLIEAGSFLRAAVLKRGYHTPKPRPMFCLVENRNACVVNFDGLIYKCPAFIGQTGYAAGDLAAGLHDYSAAYRLDIWKNRECAECEYLPLCFGGCRYMTFVRNGSIDGVDCKRAYLDATLETFIKQDVQYRRPAGSP